MAGRKVSNAIDPSCPPVGKGEKPPAGAAKRDTNKELGLSGILEPGEVDNPGGSLSLAEFQAAGPVELDLKGSLSGYP